MVTANDLYKMKPIEVSRNICELVDTGHFTESGIESYDLLVDWDEQDPYVQIKKLKDPYIDGRRTCKLSTVWYNEKPVMVIQNAGRDGIDHRERFITDVDLFKQLCEYIRTLPTVYTDINNVINPNDDNSDLINFYGSNVLELN